MWWIYEKTYEDSTLVRYSYAREDNEMDGEIEYNKESKEVRIIRECSGDRANEWCCEKSLEKFMAYVAGESFPQRRRVVIG